MSKVFRFLENYGSNSMSSQEFAARYTLIEAQSATDNNLELELYNKQNSSTDELEIHAKMTLLTSVDDLPATRF